MHTHPEQMKHTRYPLKLFFFFSPKGEIKTEKSEENFKYNEHWGEKVHRANCFNEKSGQKKQYPYFKQNPLLYTPLSLGSMTEKSFLQAFQTWKKNKRDLVWEEVTVFFQASCASLRVGFFQCCWQWGEALWWLMLLKAPVWCNNRLNRCSPGLRCPARRWTRLSQESLLSTAVRSLENKSETQEHHSIKWNTGKRGQMQQ